MMNTEHRKPGSPGIVLTLTDSQAPLEEAICSAIESLRLKRRTVENLEQLLLQLSTMDRSLQDRCLVIANDRFSGSAMEQIVHLQLQRIYLPMVVVRRLDDELELPFRHVFVLPSDASVAELSEAIKSAIEMSRQYNRLVGQVALFDTLNEREMDIVKLASSGMPNKSIARKLEISVKTVEKYRRTAYQKLQVASAAEMASLYTFSQFVSGR